MADVALTWTACGIGSGGCACGLCCPCNYNQGMHVEFDPAKHQRNISERALGFDQVANFDFGTALVWQDERKAYPEARYVALGFLDARLHVLCFTPVAGGIRAISFRKANTREVRDYESTRCTD